MQRLHFIIFLLLIFISFIGINPSPEFPKGIKSPAKSFSMIMMEPSEIVISEWHKNTMHALKRECGACHQSSRAESPNTALDIFDLDLSNWTENVDSEILRAISQRALTDMFSQKEIEDIKYYVDYKLAVKAP